MERFGLATFVLMLVVGTLVRQYAPKVTNLPFTVIMMIAGMVTGAVIQSRDNHKLTAKSIREWYEITPEVLLWAIIPVLVFESAFNCETHIFAKLKAQILTLAGPGVLVASILTALFVKTAFVEYDWDWPTSLMFGAMTSATDPVAVVALLKELGVSERLGTLIEGESLLNDGTAIVVFEVFYDALEEDVCRPAMPSAGTVLIFLVRLGLVGPVLGCCCGSLATWWLGSMLNDPFSEIIITLVACYGSFALGEGIVHTSGVLTVVFTGMWINKYGKPHISSSAQQAVQSFWGVFAHIANIVVFFITGMIMTVKVFAAKKKDLGEDCVRCAKEEEEEEEEHHYDDGEHSYEDDSVERRFLRQLFKHGTREISRRLERPEEAEEHVECHSFRMIDVWYLIQLYIALHVVRVIVVALSAPVLWRGAYGMTVSQAAVIAYGGLRGAVGLALGLIINDTDGFPSRLQNRILFQIAGIAFLTLMINGTTARYVLHWLKLDRTTDAQDEIFAHVTVDVDKKVAGEMTTLRGDPYLGDADWQMVWRYLPTLTADSYWFRLRDNFVHLSSAEKRDLSALTKRKARLMAQEEKRKKIGRSHESCSESLEGALRDFLFRSFGNHAGEYPLPKRLRPVWFGAHKSFGNTPPRFIHMSEHRITAGAMSARDASLAASAVSLKQHRDGLEYDAVSTGQRPGRLERVRSYGHVDILRAVKGSSLMMDQDHTKHHANGMSMASPDDEEHLEIAAAASIGVDQHPQAQMRTSAGSLDERPSEARLHALQQAEAIPMTKGEERLLEEARERCLWAVKANLQVAFAKGRLMPAALQMLQECCEEQEDDASRRLDGWERMQKVADTANVTWLEDVKSCVPSGLGIRNKMDGAIFRHTALVFELAYNFVHAHEDVDLDELTDDAKVRKKLAAEIVRQQMLAKRAINDFQKTFPMIACAVKTKVAARFMLIHHQELFEEMYEHGHITEKECETACKAVDESRLRLAHHPYVEQQPHLEYLLGDIPFLAPLSPDERRAVVNDATTCRTEILVAGTVLAKQGKNTLEQRSDYPGRTGWFVIIRGSVVVSQQTPGALALSGGKGPASEIPASPTNAAGESGDPDDVVLGAGAVCCLEEQLLDMRFAATYKTVSMCHVAFFDRQAMRDLAARNAAVRFSLWWSVALSALRGYEDFSKLPARELDALSRHAKFVEAPEDPKAYPNSGKPKAPKKKKPKTRKPKKQAQPYSYEEPMDEYQYAAQGTVTERQAAPSAAHSDPEAAPLDPAAANEGDSTFIESILGCATGGQGGPNAGGGSPSATVDPPQAADAVYVADESKQDPLETWNEAKARGAKSPKAVRVPLPPPVEEEDDDDDEEEEEEEEDDDDDLMLELMLPPHHSLLILRGMAKTMVSLGPQGRPYAEVARAISIVTIDESSTTRVVKLGFAAKAFILDDNLLNAKGLDIHADHHHILQDPDLAEIHDTVQSRKNLQAAGLARTENPSWIKDHHDSRNRRVKSQSKALLDD